MTHVLPLPDCSLNTLESTVAQMIAPLLSKGFRVVSERFGVDSWMKPYGSVVVTNDATESEESHQCES